jgi:hypothetical protein
MKAAPVQADSESTLSAAAHPQVRSEAPPSLLLEHLSRLGLGYADSPSARARLEQALNPELAARLVSALAGDHGMRRAF